MSRLTRFWNAISLGREEGRIRIVSGGFGIFYREKPITGVQWHEIEVITAIDLSFLLGQWPALKMTCTGNRLLDVTGDEQGYRGLVRAMTVELGLAPDWIKRLRNNHFEGVWETIWTRA